MSNIETLCLQGGYTPQDGEARSLPIQQTTTFYYEKGEDMADLFDLKKAGFFYSRLANPTVDGLEQKISALDGGVAAMATASGQSASMMAIMNVCSAGDHMVAMSTIYGGTFNLLNITLRKFGIDCTFLDPASSKSEIEAAIQPNTKLIFGETIANPALVVLDFEKISAVAKEQGVLFMVDNTLATPVLCRPFEYGADIVVYSSTKYLEGHGSTIGGIIVEKGTFEYAGNERFKEFNEPDESYHGLVYSRDCAGAPFVSKARLQLMRDMGAMMSPQTAWITNLGIETLALRMERHSSNALTVAQKLKAHKSVAWVKYATLEEDENSARATKYMSGKGTGIIAFGVKGGKEAALSFIDNINIVKQATHIADARSCCLHPATTTHRQLSSDELVACGISEDFIRLSVGIEGVDDIANDILGALDAL